MNNVGDTLACKCLLPKMTLDIIQNLHMRWVRLIKEVLECKIQSIGRTKIQPQSAARGRCHGQNSRVSARYAELEADATAGVEESLSQASGRMTGSVN